MKAILLSVAALLILGLLLPISNGFAEDPAVLFEKLTCHTCHGPQGRGGLVEGARDFAVVIVGNGGGSEQYCRPQPGLMRNEAGERYDHRNACSG